MIAELLRRSAIVASKPEPPRILAGAGLTADNLRPFLDATYAQRIHIGSAARFGGDPLAPIDPRRIREIRRILQMHLEQR